jgi:hypothetical protein
LDDPVAGAKSVSGVVDLDIENRSVRRRVMLRDENGLATAGRADSGITRKACDRDGLQSSSATLIEKSK